MASSVRGGVEQVRGPLFGILLLLLVTGGGAEASHDMRDAQLYGTERVEKTSPNRNRLTKSLLLVLGAASMQGSHAHSGLLGSLRTKSPRRSRSYLISKKISKSLKKSIAEDKLDQQLAAQTVLADQIKANQVSAAKIFLERARQSHTSWDSSDTESVRYDAVGRTLLVDSEMQELDQLNTDMAFLKSKHLKLAIDSGQITLSEVISKQEMLDQQVAAQTVLADQIKANQVSAAKIFLSGLSRQRHSGTATVTEAMRYDKDLWRTLLVDSEMQEMAQLNTDMMKLKSEAALQNELHKECLAALRVQFLFE